LLDEILTLGHIQFICAGTIGYVVMNKLGRRSRKDEISGQFLGGIVTGSEIDICLFLPLFREVCCQNGSLIALF